MVGPSTSINSNTSSKPLPLIIGLISTAAVIIGAIVIIKKKVMKEKDLAKVKCTEINMTTIPVETKC